MLNEVLKTTFIKVLLRLCGKNKQNEENGLE